VDQITAVATALALGAAAGLTDTAKQAVKDGYLALKTLITSRFPSMGPSVDQLENAPGSGARRAVVEEDLASFDACADAAVLARAGELLSLVRRESPEAAAAVGVSLKDIEGAALRISDVRSSGIGVQVENAEIKGDIEIRGIRAGEDPDPK
jgi:hypothetical protein